MPGSPRAGEKTRTLWIAVALAVAVVAAYLPALDGEFLGWDDNLYVTENPHIRDGLSAETVRAVVSTVHTGNWIPLTWLSHALDLELYGLEPRGHHATALALHVANTILLLLILCQMTGAIWQSAVVAALFGLHPIHVESVAWVSERKDVLSTAFWLLATLAYLRWVRRPSGARWGAVVVAFGLGLLAKPMLMTFPCTLLLLDSWPLRRLSWQAVREKLSLFALALTIGGVAFVAQRSAGAMELASLVGPADRVANAVVSYVRYLGLALWPVGLSPWYSHPVIEGPPLAPMQIVGAAGLLAALSGLAIATRQRWPYLLVGWLWYLGTLLPVIGLIHFGAHGMADRYTYVPMIGLAIAVVWAGGGVVEWVGGVMGRVGGVVGWVGGGARSIAAALVVALLVGLAAATWRQSQVWHDSTTFWTSTIERNPRSGVGHYALANIYTQQHRVPEAMAHYRRALELRPDPWKWHVELAELAYRHGDRATAQAHYELAIERRPDDAVLHAGLGNVLMQARHDIEARRHLERAIELHPDFAQAYDHLGIVLQRAGERREAIRAFRAALAIDPGLASARANLNMVLSSMPKEDRAE